MYTNCRITRQCRVQLKQLSSSYGLICRVRNWQMSQMKTRRIWKDNPVCLLSLKIQGASVLFGSPLSSGLRCFSCCITATPVTEMTSTTKDWLILYLCYHIGLIQAGRTLYYFSSNCKYMTSCGLLCLESQSIDTCGAQWAKDKRVRGSLHLPPYLHNA